MPSVTKQIYIPFDGEGYNGGNTYSGAYFIDESYGGEILMDMLEEQIKMETLLQ